MLQKRKKENLDLVKITDTSIVAVLSTEPPFPVESQGNPRTPCGFLVDS